MLEAMYYKASSMFFVAKSGNSLITFCYNIYFYIYWQNPATRRTIPQLQDYYSAVA